MHLQTHGLQLSAVNTYKKSAMPFGQRLLPTTSDLNEKLYRTLTYYFENMYHGQFRTI